MTFTERVDAAIKEAMKAKDAARLRGLRDIKSQILLAKTDGSGDEMTEEKEIKILQKMLKQRKDSRDLFLQQNREDLAAKESEEIAVIEEFLPKAMTQDELEAEIRAIIAEVGAEGPKDMGKVMGAATKRIAGRAEGRAISEAVKKLL